MIVPAIILGGLAIVLLVIGLLSFLEKGVLLNNAYLFAPKQERERMDKKSLYRQSAVVFSLFAAAFLCMALEAAFMTGWLWICAGAICIAALAFAIKSSIR